MKLRLILYIALISFRASAQVIAGLYINEVVASNELSHMDNTGDNKDWVELYNSNGYPIDLANFYMSDISTQKTKFRFTNVTSQVVVPANGKLIIYCSGHIGRGVKHTNFTLDELGESIILTAPDGTTLVDQVTFTKQRQDVSYGRFPDGSTTLKFFSPTTPNANNANPYDEILPDVNFSQIGGFFTSNFSLSLSHIDPLVSIYYTLDGSDPSPSKLSPTTFLYKQTLPSNINDPVGNYLYDRSYRSFTYSTSIAISDKTPQPNYTSMVTSTCGNGPYYEAQIANFKKGTVVRAIAIKTGSLPSDIKTNTYIYSNTGLSPYTFPVVSLAIQENYLYDFNSGYHVAGINRENAVKNGSAGSICQGNFTVQGDPKTGSFEYFVNSQSVFSRPITWKINGATTRALAKKII